MKTGLVIALVGGILAVLFAFDNLGQYLMAGQDYLGLTILLPLAALVGALPGLMIGCIAHRRRPK